jgi:hypothetical protein
MQQIFLSIGKETPLMSSHKLKEEEKQYEPKEFKFTQQITQNCLAVR